MELSTWGPALDAMERGVDTYIEQTSRLRIDSAISHPGDMTREQGLIHIDATLKRLASIEEKLKASRIFLQGIRNTSVTLAPINRLPTDVLAMIIIAGHEQDKGEEERRKAEETDSGILSSESGASEDGNPGAGHFPTTFSHVCCRWRDVALGTTAVWGHLVFGTPSSYERAAAWVQRTKRSDLNLELRMANTNRAMEVLGRNVLRATSLVLEVFHRVDLVEGLKHLNAHERPPPLKQLTVLVRSSIGTLFPADFGEERWGALMDMTAGLEHVYFRGMFLPLGGPAYRGLKTLQLEYLNRRPEPGGQRGMDRGLLTVFKESPNLESLSLIDVEPLRHQVEGSVGPPSSIVLRRLKTLVVQKMSLQLTSFILSTLSAPALEKFALSDYASSTPRNYLQHRELPALLLAFFQNSQPASLKVFRLHNIEVVEIDLHFDQILAYTPGLEFLHVKERQGFGTAALKAMLSPERLVPRLERLWLQDCAFSAQPLKELVLQRNSLDSAWPIRSLMVRRCSIYDSDSTVLPILRSKVGELEWGFNAAEDHPEA